MKYVLYGEKARNIPRSEPLKKGVQTEMSLNLCTDLITLRNKDFVVWDILPDSTLLGVKYT